MIRLTYQENDGAWGIVGMNKENQDEKMYMVACKLRDYENLELQPDEVGRMKDKIGIGSVIQGYKITAIMNNYCIAESKTAPDPFVVWAMDCDGLGVHAGTYLDNVESAQAKFAELAFKWNEHARDEMINIMANVSLKNHVMNNDEVRDFTNFMISQFGLPFEEDET